MINKPGTSPGKHNVAQEWDGMDFEARAQLIREIIATMPESEREYIADREHHPVFSNVDLNKTLAEQDHSEKLRTALNAVFLNSEIGMAA